AVGVIAPAVIAAAELLRIAARVGDDLRPAVGALVVDDVDAAVAVAREQHGLGADARRDEIARVLHLAFMADIDPGALEDALHLERENRWIGIKIAMHAVRLDELREHRRAVLRHGGASQSLLASQRGWRRNCKTILCSTVWVKEGRMSD